MKEFFVVYHKEWQGEPVAYCATEELAEHFVDRYLGYMNEGKAEDIHAEFFDISELEIERMLLTTEKRTIDEEFDNL